ncbi:hypothetical protein JRO89_XS08G0204500 [Xanthoceras sorbifolium]|uniref:Uncharacterized protein n=1 Tax=Xanthoceras sorbifolium TaxID=99658 RepID=A0ABQ8HQK8_9ROSI|nr:hypothetical protein JRO89_XS08G0204500 [Xanthoceras sorbifolium]
MDSKPADSASQSSAKPPDVEPSAKDSNADAPVKASIVESPPAVSSITNRDSSGPESTPSMPSPSRISSWAKNLTFPKPVPPQEYNSQAGSAGMSTFARFTSELGMRLPSVTRVQDENVEGTSTAAQGGVLESLKKGLVDSSKNAVKAMQVKARHIVSQNKRRYQEGEFDLDMTYITENIIAMGFPAGDISSGLFGYIEGFYRNHMEEVIKFFETHHKVASFPFTDHNCPPIQLIPSFCQSAYSWLKDDISNVVVVHCKAGMARTGLMICSLLLFLKFFPTADEAIDSYNQKRCVDGKALVLPSACLGDFVFINALIGLGPPLLSLITVPEDFWIKAPKKGIVVFALPGQPGLTELVGDFKIHFHDGQGDFYCWLNTTMTENRKILDASDLDGFDKRKLPSPGFKVEIVMVDYDGTLPTSSKANSANQGSDGSSASVSVPTGEVSGNSSQSKVSKSEDDDVFSDSDGEESGASKSQQAHIASEGDPAVHKQSNTVAGTEKLSLRSQEPTLNNVSKEPTVVGSENPASAQALPHLDSVAASDFKAIAADTSVFTFGDEEDYESE